MAVHAFAVQSMIRALIGSHVGAIKSRARRTNTLAREYASISAFIFTSVAAVASHPTGPAATEAYAA